MHVASHFNQNRYGKLFGARINLGLPMVRSGLLEEPFIEYVHLQRNPLAGEISCVILAYATVASSSQCQYCYLLATVSAYRTYTNLHHGVCQLHHQGGL